MGWETLIVIYSMINSTGLREQRKGRILSKAARTEHTTYAGAARPPVLVNPGPHSQHTVGPALLQLE